MLTTNANKAVTGPFAEGPGVTAFLQGLRIVLSLFLCVILSFRGESQQTHEKVVRPVDFLLSLPDGYQKDTSVKWPLVVFLHGSGESGADLEKVKVHGPPKLIEHGKKFPFIVVAPQCPDARYGWQADDLFFLLQECKRLYHVDPDRVYLTGLSMGGFGTWALAMKHPEEFAAIVPICGGGDTADLWKLRNMPVWCFHGGKDSTVPIERDREMVESLRKYNPSVRFTVYPELGHNSWTVTYENDSLYQWLLSKKRFVYTETPLAETALKEYEGIFVSPEGGRMDTVVIHVDGGKLYAQVQHRENIEMKGCATDDFFIPGDRAVEIKFLRGGSGSGKVRKETAAYKVSAFVVYMDKRVTYNKIESAKK